MCFNASRLSRASSGALALTIAVLAAGAVRANGAFPDEFSIHLQANAPSRILIGANFGLLVSEDDGATWRYSCEPWIVAGSNAAVNPESSVSFYQVTADGALLADAVNITRSADMACTWPTSTGSLQGQVITDIFASPTDATLVLAIVAIVKGSYIVASHDGGRTFDSTQLYSTSQVLTGVEIARVPPAVVYAITVAVSGSGATLARSNDAGAHWMEKSIPDTSGKQARILAVDPADANLVYLRVLTGVVDSIVITSDGGQTFQTALTINGQFSSFLRASDGTLYAGTAGGALYVSPPGSMSFSRRTGPRFRCLGQRPGSPRLYACGDFITDGFNLYTSDDGGQTFVPRMKFTDIQGPLTCLPVQTNCAAHWQRIQGMLGIGATPDAGQTGPGTPPPSAGRSGCSSLGAGAALLVILTFSFRRAKS